MVIRSHTWRVLAFLKVDKFWQARDRGIRNVLFVFQYCPLLLVSLLHLDLNGHRPVKAQLIPDPHYHFHHLMIAHAPVHSRWKHHLR